MICRRASFALIAAVLLAVMAVTVRAASANDESTFWSKTTTERAVAHFPVGDPAHLVTNGSVRIVRTWQSSSFIGVKVDDIVSLRARLRLCDTEGCRTVWTVRAETDITADGSFRSGGLDSASLDTQLLVTVQGRDY